MFSCSHFLSNRKQKVRQWRNRDQWIWCQGTSWAKRSPSARFEWSKHHKESRIGSELCFIQRQETDAETSTKTQQCVLKRGKTRWHSIFQHQETGAEGWTFKLSPRQETGARWCRQRWKPPFILDQITLKIWKSGTQTSEELQNLFYITQKLILDHQLKFWMWHRSIGQLSWTRSTLSHDQVMTWRKARVRVYSDPVLCLGKLSDYFEANQRWEKSSCRISTVQFSQNYL